LRLVLDACVRTAGLFEHIYEFRVLQCQAHPLPLRERKAALARIGAGAEGWIALTNGVVSEGRALYQAVVDADRRASSPSIWPTPTTRRSPGGTRCSIGVTRSVAAATKGFASAAGAMPDTG
jgi:hypothetical protein